MSIVATNTGPEGDLDSNIVPWHSMEIPCTSVVPSVTTPPCWLCFCKTTPKKKMIRSKCTVLIIAPPSLHPGYKDQYCECLQLIRSNDQLLTGRCRFVSALVIEGVRRDKLIVIRDRLMEGFFFYLYERFYHSMANEATGSSTECYY